MSQLNIEKTNTVHHLKIQKEHFDAIFGGKTAEIRNNDRDFKVGEFLVLNEVDSSLEKTGRWTVVCINHILTADEFPCGLQKGYCMLSFGLSNNRFFEDSEGGL
ncbi:DUF3850 domain-containing protein [Pseudoalteromonas aurantia]|uniref:DUF3850 domain-containing protein n=1 Tax=Pseudoalteromonas aurantia TaxID=43654 RepID=A0ABY2VYT3_9GAMM|nr:DUF3850 domain-containing protein [Pseudoalteromonas aurantia]TMO75314.1 hypothetical protein CWC20_08310 [Pseudoalteromonas aurantia]